MNRNMFQVLIRMLIMQLTLAQAPDDAGNGGVMLPDPKLAGKIEYIRPDIPKPELPAYEGERYEAWVPATLDLAERARLALHALTSMTNPNIEYEQYFTVT